MGVRVFLSVLLGRTECIRLRDTFYCVEKGSQYYVELLNISLIPDLFHFRSKLGLSCPPILVSRPSLLASLAYIIG